MDLSQTAAAVLASEPFTWSTRLDFDRELVPRLLAAHQALAARLDGLVQSGLSASAATLRAMAAHCIDELRAIQRLEALRLYPLLDRRLQARPDGAAGSATALRLELNAMSRRLLRVLEDLAGLAGELPRRPQLLLSRALFQRYFARKREALYPSFLEQPAAA